MRLWLVAAFCSLVGIAQADTLSGRVVAVHDGDTITVLDANRTQHKIRLAGIDAPELGQAFGNPSKQNLSKWVYNRQVIVDWNKRDRFCHRFCLLPPQSKYTEAIRPKILVSLLSFTKQTLDR